MTEPTQADKPKIVRDVERLWQALESKRAFGWIMRRPWFSEIMRFGLVGLANTAVNALVYFPLLWLGTHYVPAVVVSWFVAFVFSFFVNCRFTYRVKPTWARLLRFPLGALVNFAGTTLGAIALVEWLDVSEKLAPYISGILAIPLTYLATTFALRGTRRNPPEAGPGV